MMSLEELGALSREQLYEKVWSKPGSQLSKDLGVSDVAIAKRCGKLNVPRPPRGYWAKLKVGHRPRRPKLPVSLEKAFVLEAEKPLKRRLSMPADSDALHPLAGEFLKELAAARLTYDKKRVHLRVPAFPEAEVSKEKASQAARAFHVLLQAIEPRGIKFRKAQSMYD
jgi:hypothetical protein